MKLINQSFEILEQKDFSLEGIKKFIERCGRVCYKSEDRITDTSYEKFVNMLENRDHSRPLEMGTVHLRMSMYSLDTLQNVLITNRAYNDQWIKYYIYKDEAYITTNYRYYLLIKSIYPTIEKYFTDENNDLYPKRYTIHMILSRGVMDEFRTHVGLSHLAESTRYCSYNKNKFNNEVTFIIPPQVNTKCPSKEQGGPAISDIEWSTAMLNAEASYMNLLKMGWKPQQARDVLSLAVKSELISCGFIDAWANFFKRRCAPDAHPMAREIALKIQDEFIRKCYIGYTS